MDHDAIIVTSTPRLAYWVTQSYFKQLELPTVLSVSEWILSLQPALKQSLINPTEERMIWQFLLKDSPLANYQEDLLAVFKLMNEWNLSPEQLVFESALEQVREQYDAFCTFLNEHQLICDVELLNQPVIRCNNKITFFGFNEVTPQRRLFWEHLKQQQVSFRRSVTAKAKTVLQSKQRFDDSETELEQAINWVMAQPAGIYGIVLSNFTEQLPMVKRLLGYKPVEDVNIAWSPRLGETTIGLFLKNLLNPPPYLDLAFWQTLLLSPLWGNWEEEVLERHQLFHKINRYVVPECPISVVLTFAPPALLKPLQSIVAFWRSFDQKHSIQEWVTIWFQFFNQIDLVKKIDLLPDQILVLDQIRSQLFNLSRRSSWFTQVDGKLAGRLFEQLLQEVLPQKNYQAKINFISALDALDVSFDALWVTQCDEKKWPAPVQLNPCLDAFWQQRLNLPHCSVDRTLEESERRLNNYRRGNQQLIFSYAQEEEGLAFSPLLKDVPESSWFPLQPKLLVEKRPLEPIPQPLRVKGLKNNQLSAQILEAQTLCPFRAFLQYHLKIKPLFNGVAEQKRIRGIKLHAILAQFYLKYAIRQMSQDDIIKWVAQILEEEDPVEKQCLKTILLDWFAQEQQRPLFNTIAVEQVTSLNVLNQNLTLRFDRLDQVGDDYFIIDYKTGKINFSVTNWLQERIYALQMPLYLLSNPQINYFGFATLVAHQVQLSFVSLEEIATKLRITKQTLLSNWKNKIERLAEDFTLGKATMEPLEFKLCTHCFFRTACRLI